MRPAGPPRLRSPRRRLPSTRLLGRIGVVDPASLDDYRAHGGYAALARAIEIGPAAVIAEVTASKLMGRGGAAFPTGRKWAAVADQPAQPHYLVCNADESEPGTFKDRVLLEGDPFATVEAMTIAAFATGAEPGLPLYPRRIPGSRGQRVGGHRGGTLGRPARRRHPRLGLRLRHRGPPRRRRLHLRRGDGALRVDRGQARRAAQQAAVPGGGRPVRQADDRQQRRDAGQHPGHRPRTAARRSRRSERTARPARSSSACPATWPGRASTRSSSARPWAISSSMAGGVPGGRAIRTILLGGAAGVFVGPDALDMPLTFEATRAASATLGSGVIMVFDETVDLVDTLRRIAQFFRDESCGQCVPCRVGQRPPGGAARTARGRVACPAARRGARPAA